MPRADTGNFNRFLTSIGLLLIAAALLIPYFYFRDNDSLQATRTELRELTPTAREAIERRQRRSVDLETPVLVFSVLLFGGGIAALFFGGKRLRIAQRKEDDAIERQARKEDYEFQQLSADEVEVKRDEQAREAVRESKVAELGPKEKEWTRTAAAPQRQRPSGPVIEGSVRNPADVRYQQMRQEIARIEERTKQLLEQLQLDRFDYFSELEIVQAGGRRRVSVDGLFKAKVPNQPDITLELTVTRMPQRRGPLDADRLLAHLVRYREMTGREALGWLLFVVPEEKASKEPDLVVLEEKFGDMLAGLGRCSIVREQDLDGLPGRFTAIFGS